MGFFATGIKIPEYIDKKQNGKYRTGTSDRIKEIFCGLITGFAGYFVSILLLSKLSISSGWFSLIFLWIAAIISYNLFRRFPGILMGTIISYTAVLGFLFLIGKGKKVIPK